MTFIDPDSIQQEQAPQAATQPSHGDFVDPDTLVSPEVKSSSTALPRGQKRKISRTEALYTGFKRAPDELAEGLLQIGGKAASAAGFDTSGFENRLANLRNQRNAEYAEAARQNPVTTRVGYVGGNLSQVGAPVGGAKTTLGKMGVGALGGALTAAAQYHEKAQSRLTSGLIGGLLGGALPIATRGIAGAGKLIRGGARRVLQPQKTAAMDAAKVLAPGRNRATIVAEAHAAKQGIPVSALDTTTSEVAKTKFRNATATQKGLQAIEKHQGVQEAAVKQQLKKMVNEVVPEGTGPAKQKIQQMYDAVLPTKVPSSINKELMSDPKIADHIAGAMRSERYPLKHAKPGTMEYYDTVKRYLDDKMQFDKANRVASPKAWTEARDKIVASMDKVDPMYAQARRKAELVKLQEKLQSQILSAPKAEGRPVSGLKELHGVLSKSVRAQTKFTDAIKKAGGNVKQARGLLKVLDAVQGSPLKAMTKRSTESRAMKFGGDISGRILDGMGDLVNGKYNEALLHIAIDPKFSKHITRLAKMSKKRNAAYRTAAALLDMVGAGTAAAGTRQLQNN